MLRSLVRSLGKGSRRTTGLATKDEQIDILVEFPLSELRLGLIEGVAHADLRALCRRLGYSDIGLPEKLATRLIEAVATPGARITRWRSYEDARTFARRLELTGSKHWYQYARGDVPAKLDLPDDIPKAPAMVYAKSGWKGWGNFLGTENPARHLIEYRAFAKARAYVRALGLTNASEWREFCRKRVGNRRLLPPDIPSAPWNVYEGKGWVSLGDWLGTDHVHASKMTYRSYAEARAFVRALGIASEPEWQAYCRGEIHRGRPRPLDIPSNPHRTYKNRGWKSWGEFLGTGSVALYNRTFRSYKAARAFVRAQGIVDNKAWRAWCAAGKRPPDIPGAPEQIYKDKGWTTWGDFLGTGNVHPASIKWKSVSEAQRIVRRLGIRTGAEFLHAKRSGLLPRDIPVTIYLRPGWKGWRSFLGTKATLSGS
jgi:hypothetical protein